MEPRLKNEVGRSATPALPAFIFQVFYLWQKKELALANLQTMPRLTKILLARLTS
jgi:hypothetical protein